MTIADLKQQTSTAEEFWDTFYQTRKLSSSGNPSALLARFTSALPTGRALDLGCAHGDDTIWLAQNGWEAVGADISETVIERARQRAASTKGAAEARFETHDLTRSFPAGTFDLVSAMFLQSPKEFARQTVLRRAAESVAPGGRLFIVSHASVSPWSWADPDTQFPEPETAYADLHLNETAWYAEFLGHAERIASGPDGQTAKVKDLVILAKRLN